MEQPSKFTVICEAQRVDPENADSEILDIIIALDKSAAQQQEESKPLEQSYLFVIDKSGSMGGEYINNTKSMLCQLITYLHKKYG